MPAQQTTQAVRPAVIPRQGGPVDPLTPPAAAAAGTQAAGDHRPGSERPMSAEERQFAIGLLAMFLLLAAATLVAMVAAA
jgi:hypothetical protein